MCVLDMHGFVKDNPCPTKFLRKQREKSFCFNTLLHFSFDNCSVCCYSMTYYEHICILKSCGCLFKGKKKYDIASSNVKWRVNEHNEKVNILC